jgi:tetratricopeptide (TPR) repeat protein
LVREAVVRHEGRQIKGLGDGFMVAFSSVRRAIACAVDMQEAQRRRNLAHPSESVLVRVGLNTGEVSEEDGDLFGETVNAAARIASAAAGGEILCADVVRQLAGTVPTVSFTDRGLVSLKGFPEPRRLWRVIGQSSVGVPVAARAAFVAREAELVELRRALEAARHGGGSVVLIGGEPGVGKTRLAEELAREAKACGMRVSVGHCYEMEGAAPYNPFVEMLEAVIQDLPAEMIRRMLADDAAEIARVIPRLRRAFPDIPSPLDLPPEQERQVLLDALRSLIARGASLRPLLLVLDDLHWADESTLLLLRHLAGQIEALPVLVVGTYREVELDSARPFARALEDLVRSRQASRVPLKRLSEESVETLLASLGGQQPPPKVVASIFSETEGNPFFVEEVFKHLLEQGRLLDDRGRFRSDLVIGDVDVPEGVRLVIGRRVERLGDRAVQVLTAASVIGRGFSFELLDAITEFDTETVLDVVDQAERAGIVRSEQVGGAARLVFSHELIRQTLLSRLSLPRRQRLHAQVGESIERMSGSASDDFVADLAYHFVQAGLAADQTKTLRYSILAGERAYEAAAFDDALAHFERALTFEHIADDATLATLFEDLGFARRSVGDLDEAVGAWNRAIDVYQRLGNSESLGRLAAEATNQLEWVGRWTESVTMAGRGLTALEGTDSRYRCRLLCQVGMAISLAGDYHAGAEMLDQAKSIAEQRGDERLLAEAIYVSGVHYFAWMQHPEALLALTQATELFEKAGMTWELTNAASFLSPTLVTLFRFNEAIAVVNQYAPHARRLGNRIPLSMLEAARAAVHFCQTADLEAAEQSINTRIELSVGPVQTEHLAELAYVEFLRGNWEHALSQLPTTPGLPGALGYGCYYRALFHANLGDRDQAVTFIEANRDQLARAGQPNSTKQWFYTFVAVETFYLCGQYDQAAALRPLTEAALRVGVLWFSSRLTHTVAGMAAAAASDWDGAQVHYEAAIQLAEQLPHLIEQADARHFYAVMLLDRDQPGDPERARELAEDAIERYQRIGMPRHVQRSAGLLR